MPDNLPGGLPPGHDASREERLGWIIAECSDLLNAGGKLDPEELLKAHPDLAADLALALDSLQRIDPRLDGRELGQLGDFRLLRQVGRGGMGVVYEAWQVSMERRVALKVLPSGIAADQKTFLRFMREARTAGKLDHQGIVSVHAMGVDRDTPYYAMEYVEGETLAQVLARIRPPAPRREGDRGSLWSGISRLFRSGESGAASPVPEAAPPVLTADPPIERPRSALDTDQVTPVWCFRVAEAFAGVAEGLQHAHSRGIVHRDLKPSNLILDLAGRLRILDFGLARLEGQESLTVSGDFIGTPLYMSPEQAMPRRIPIDHRTDIYSLGATLYETLTWRPPFRGKDHQDTLSQIVSRDPDPPRRIEARVPRELENIVLKCLRKDPADRYGTAEALSQDLRRFVRGDPIEARPPSGWAKARRRLLRHRLKVLVSLTALLLLVTSGLLLHEVKSRRLAGDRLLYRERVIDAAMLLEMCELTARAGSGKPAEIDPQNLFMDGDFLALAREADLNPLSAAVEKLAEAEALDAAGPEAPYYRARGLILLGEKEKAVEELARAVRRSPGFVPAVTLLGDLDAASGKDRPLPEAAAEDPAGAPAKEGAASWGSSWLLAHRALRSRDFRAAAEAYTGLLQEIDEAGEPYLGASVEFHLGKGRALLEDGETSGAIESFVAARTLWPRAKVPQLLLGKAYYLKGEKENAESTFLALHEQSGALKDEIAIWVAALYKYLRDNARGLEWAGRLKRESLRLRLEVDFNVLLGRDEEAVRLGRDAVRRFPDDSRTHHFLAVALLRDPRTLREALDVARRASELDPRNADTLSLLAAAYQDNRDPRKAEELFLKAIEIAPREPRAYDHLGLLLQRLGRLDEAQERLRQAVQIVEGSARFQILNPHNSLALLLVQRGNAEEAIRCYRKAMEFQPGSAAPFLNLGLLHLRRGESGEAEASFRKAIEVEERDPRGFGHLGSLLLSLVRAGEAVPLLEEAVRLEPRYARAACDLGRALEKLARREEAFAAYLANLKSGARDREVFEGLISLERREGRDGAFAARWDEAAEYFEGAGDPSAQKPGVMSFIALALVRGRARADLDRARELASRAVDATRGREPECLAALAEVESEGGNGEKAVRLLEDAVRFPRAKVDLEGLLEGDRRRLFPRLASFASVDWALASILPQGTGAREAAQAFSGAGEEPPPALLHYLEGRVLQRAGRSAEALAELEEAGRLAGPSRLISLRIAECRRAAGDPALAEGGLRRAIETRPGDDPELWGLWFEICFLDLGWSPSEVLGSFPARAPRKAVDSGAEPGEPAADYADDCRWLLERLEAGDPIRIDCGAKGYRSPSGEEWGGDRFYRGGARRTASPGEVTGTEDDALFQSVRWFEADELPGGYRLPLPPGTYRIGLRFADLPLARSPQPMDVLIEGRRELAGYAPSRAGFAAADERSFEREVLDGELDIDIVPLLESGMVSALEVERVEER